MKIKINFKVRTACDGVAETEDIKATFQNTLAFLKTLRKELEDGLF